MKKAISAFIVFAAVVAAWGVLPAQADIDLEGNITAIDCGLNTLEVLGKTVDTTTAIFKNAPCADLGVGDRVKIACTDNSCDTANKVEWKEAISGESAVASVPTPVVDCATDCADPAKQNFTLSNGVVCSYSGAEVKDKKNFSGSGPVPTPEQVCNFLCGAALGTTPGTLLVKCEGHYDSGASDIDPATKVDLKQ